jgi:hypothetical protein
VKAFLFSLEKVGKFLMQNGDMSETSYFDAAGIQNAGGLFIISFNE